MTLTKPRPLFLVALVAAAGLAVPLICCQPEDSGGALAPDVGEDALPTPVDFGFSLVLEPVVDLNQEVTFLTHAGDGSGRLFLVTRTGFVRVIRDGALDDEPFLDVSDLVETGGGEQGLLGLAFAPDFATSGVFFIDFTADGSGRTVLARLSASADHEQADRASLEEVLTFAQPASNHNGGHLAFGPDGYLYVGTGDGGGSGDPNRNGQNLDTLLGKLLRLDVSGPSGYAVPPDNPFVGAPDARPEIWAYGLRNPWRFSFDRETGDLFIGDVGQNNYEEVDFQPAASGGGENYGWNRLEGLHCFAPRSDCDIAGTVLPVAEYDHDVGCSITGGYVYRGASVPLLTGIYLFGDFCSGRLFGLRRTAAGAFERDLVLPSSVAVASFGEDEQGELYLLDLYGEVFRVTAVPDP